MNSVYITCVRINYIICLVLLKDMFNHQMTAQKLKYSLLLLMNRWKTRAVHTQFYLQNDCYWTVFPYNYHSYLH
jgi:hypothetical protein